PIPLHVQVERLLRELIRSPEHRDGGLLPDEVGLARELGVSRNTVRAGITKLVTEGLVERRRGVGTRVLADQAAISASPLSGFARSLEDAAAFPQVLAVDARWVVAAADESRALGIAEKHRILRIDRIRGQDDQPAVRLRSWVHPDLALRGDEDFTVPLHLVIEHRLGIAVTASLEHVSAAAAESDVATALGIKRGAPVLLRKRTLRDAGGRALEHAWCHYRGDRATFSCELRRPEA
ncbi:MAG: GntR family transcriptional regulator, partial [Planctomycetes bacterium]|nr:GntR family transcriptional regulator [Planctomycetota bacterium]